MAEDKGCDRFRSFAERYVIARAGSFDPSKSLEDSWACVQEAKKVYMLIARASDDLEPPQQVPNAAATQGPSAASMLGLTGAIGSSQHILDMLQMGDVPTAQLVRNYVLAVRHQGTMLSPELMHIHQLATKVLTHDAAKNVAPRPSGTQPLTPQTLADKWYQHMKG